MSIAINTQGKEVVNAQKEKPRHSGAFLHFNYWRREPESNRPKRLCRPLHNRFAIAPQADRNLAADSLICLVDKLQVHQTKREALLPLMYGAGDEARTRDLNLGKVALYQLSYSRIALLHNALHFYFANSAVLQKTGAGDEARTRDLNLGKVALYQLSYSRIALLTTDAKCRLIDCNYSATRPLLRTACIGETRLWRTG